MTVQEQFGQIDIYVFDQILRGNLAEGMTVLDAGCGYGRNLVHLLREGCNVYALDANAAGVEHVRQLAAELAPLGVHVTIVEPGPFRTDFLTPESIRFGAKAIPDYEERRTAQRATFEQRNGKQPGDPVKLAEALVRLANDAAPPMRFAAGAMAVTLWDAKMVTLHAELDKWRALGLATDFAEGR